MLYLTIVSKPNLAQLCHFYWLNKYQPCSDLRENPPPHHKARLCATGCRTMSQSGPNSPIKRRPSWVRRANGGIRSWAMWRARRTGRFTLFVKPCQEYWFTEKKLLSTLQRIVGRFMGHKTKGGRRGMKLHVITAMDEQCHRHGKTTLSDLCLSPDVLLYFLVSSLFFQPMRLIELESASILRGIYIYIKKKKQHVG